MSNLGAHQLSTATLVAFLTIYTWAVEHRRPLPSIRAALQIGGMWALLTILFELCLGLLVTGQSWSELIHNYDLSVGRLWVFVPAWLAIGPAVVRALRVAELRS